ncbi:hypothetical protein [Cecembia rubra]|uniref:Uncharacterized protein n=1 Tax=Cecembia rubra TaxID=1485585 RepID=A0A2P8EAQ8_9BACT|nr:hypothetical protein [Cecembia rubra]PSL06535.1 hypothetical protein CLV48_102352 [Cecembia rubra]
MGRVTVNPAIAFKGHVGTPNPPTDFNSIEAAVRGHMSNPPSSINDFDTLVALANWQLLDEQAAQQNGTPILRGQQPTSYGHFQGFPKVSISVVNFQETFAANGDLQIGFQINTNFFVGYPITFSFNFQVGPGIGGLTAHNFTIQAGQTSVFCSFIRTGVAQGTNWSISYTGSDQTVYNEIALTTGWSGTATLPPNNFTAWSVISHGGLFCDNSGWTFGPSPVTHWALNLTVGSTVWLNSAGTVPAPNGYYNFGSPCDPNFTSSGIIYEVVNGVITQTLSCNYPPCEGL